MNKKNMRIKGKKLLEYYNEIDSNNTILWCRLQRIDYIDLEKEIIFTYNRNLSSYISLDIDIINFIIQYKRDFKLKKLLNN